MSTRLPLSQWAVYPEPDRHLVAICTGDGVEYVTPHDASTLGRALIRNAQIIGRPSVDPTKTFGTKTTEATEQLRAMSADLGSQKLIAILAKLAVEETETDKVD